MAFELALATVADTPVLVLRGRITGATAPVLAGWLGEHVPAPPVWDISAVDYLSSAGIRVLLTHEKRERAAGRTTTLAGMQPSVADLLEIAGMGTFWPRSPDAETACRQVAATTRAPAARVLEHGGARFAWTAGSGASGPMEQLAFDGLEPTSLAELGLAVGRGGMGASRAEAAAHPVRFTAIGGIVAMQDPDGACDHLQAALPHAAFVHVAGAVALRGEPAFTLRTEAAVGSAALFAACRAAAGDGWLGIVSCSADGARRQLDVAVLEPGRVQPDAPSPALQWTAAGVLPQELAALAAALESADDLEAVAGGAPGASSAAVAFVWRADALADGSAARLRVEAPEGFSEEAELIARNLYHDCSAIRLTRLTGGYSAATYAVESHDREGRRTIPTVLKVSTHAFTDREERAYHQYVRNFILNNSTVIMGRANRGASAGLRYNFVGITGAGAKLHSLADVHALQPVADLRRLYLQLAGSVLQPWYGQWREREVSLFDEHDPRVLFTGLEAVAAEVLGIDPDAPTLDCTPLARPVANPWWFFRHEWPRLRTQLTRCRVSITHGDLNLNNVLVDERENLYVIDFSETRERNVCSDFARLEPLLTLQHPRLDSDEDELRVLLAHRDLHGHGDFFAVGEPAHPSGDPVLDKALAMAALLRGLARRHAGDVGGEAAYLLPLLQWTLPLVCFVQLPLRTKRVSTWVGGMIVERLQRSLRG